MNKAIIGVLAGVVGVALIIYMMMQGNGIEKVDLTNMGDNTSQVMADVAKEQSPKPVEDEQMVQLLKIKKEAGKSGLSKLYLVKCSSCHGRDGLGPVGSPIAGKDKEYNLNALQKYKKGEVKNTMMKGILEHTSDSELEILAEEISTFK